MGRFRDATAAESIPPVPERPMRPDERDADFWYVLIDEVKGGQFIDQSPRTMQKYRQQGGGPKYVYLSSRCVKYRRIDLKEWADARLCASTAEYGGDHAAS